MAALVDSGAEQNLISSELDEQLQIPVQTISHPPTVTGIIRKNITSVAHHDPNLHIIISGKHHELGEFLIFDSSSPHLILESPE